MPPGWWVYILKSETTGATYTGVTTDFQRRLRQHNGELAGGARSTRRGRPWVGIHLEGPMGKSDSLRRELRIKSWPRKRKLALAGLFEDEGKLF
jgi:predicted GIY-YIG superfamily endonuclease